MVNPYKPPENNNKPVIYDFYGIFAGLSLFVMSISIMLSVLNIIAVKRPIFYTDNGFISFIIVLSVFGLGVYCGKTKQDE